MILTHLGLSGLRLEGDGWEVAIDPPEPVAGPVVITWSETDRLAGARRSSGPLAAWPSVLRWIGREGVGLNEPCSLGGVQVTAFPFTPIPWATPAEAVRKVWSGLRRPDRAARRLRWTLGRPDDPPLVLRIEAPGIRIGHYGQALHRFLAPAAFDALTRAVGEVDVAIAGTDYDDEAATDALLARVPARHRVLIDLVGEVREALGLPTRAWGMRRGRWVLPEGGYRGEAAAPDLGGS